jgi:teichuronic acid biosynthesis glycosyltransferase TuaC
MLRVLHVTGAYPTQENPMSHIFVKLQIDSLSQVGIAADVCVLKGSGFLKYIFGVRQIRKRLKDQAYDLIHAHYMYAGWTARLSSTLPLVVTFLGSDVYGKVRGNGTTKLISRTIHVFLSRMLCTLAAAAVVPSDKMSRLVGNSSIVIPHGVNLEVFSPQEMKREGLQLAKNRFYVLFAGLKSNSVKRFPLAQRAMDILKMKHPDSELIEMEGLSQAGVAELMNSVNCLLVTSRHEAGPMVIKEALACNLPVVSVDVGDAVERLTGVDNCYLVSPNPQEIAGALELVLASSRRSLNARVKINDVTLEASALKLCEVYENAVHKGRNKN